MSPEEILKSQGIFLRNAIIDQSPVSIGYIKEFRWSWMATQLNTFIFISDHNAKIDRNVIEQYSQSCFQFAVKNNKGWPRGLQSGVGSIALLRGNAIGSDAVDYCERVIKKHWSAFEIPVIYDQRNRRLIKYLKNPLWGRIFFPYFSNLIEKTSHQL